MINSSCHDYEPLYATDRSHVVMKCNEHVDRLFFAPQNQTFSERPARFERDFLGAALPGREQRYGEASSRSYILSKTVRYSPSLSILYQYYYQLYKGVAIGRLCDKCDGRCVICDSYVRPSTLVRICDECNYGSFQVNLITPDNI